MYGLSSYTDSFVGDTDTPRDPAPVTEIYKDIDLSLRDVVSMYPTASTMHQIMEEAVGSDDLSTVRVLSRSKYLPIRWSAFTDTPSPVRDIMRKAPTTESITAIEDKDQILLSVRKSNHRSLLATAMLQGRVDVITYLLSLTGNSVIDTPISVTETVGALNLYLLPRETLLYLLYHNLIDVPNEVRHVVFDDPGFEPSSLTELIPLVFRCDALNTYRVHVESMIGTIDPAWDIHGNVLTYMVSRTTDTSRIIALMPKLTSYHMRILLSKNLEVQAHIALLVSAAQREYIEVLDEFMDNEDIPVVMTYPGIVFGSILVQYLNFRMKGLGDYLSAAGPVQRLPITEDLVRYARLWDNLRLLRTL